MKNKLLIIASILTLLLAAPKANAQWTLVNGSYGGNTICFASIGTNLFAGTFNGVLLSTDSGGSWSAVNNGLTNTVVTSLAVIGTNLFAANNEGAGASVFLSTDSGKSWSAVNNGLKNRLIEALAVIGTNLFAAPYNGVEGTYNGVLLSTDNGMSWTAMNKGLRDTEVINLAVSGTNLFAGTSNGAFRSTDSGKSWSAVNTGFPTIPIDIEVSTLITSGTNLIAELDNNAGLYLSIDSGKNWALGTTLPYFSLSAEFAEYGSTLFAGISGYGVYLSPNNGVTWSAVDNTGFPENLPGGVPVSSVAVSGDYVFAGTNGDGIWRRARADLTQPSAIGEQQIVSSEIQSYPNPFSQSTTISFSTPESGVAEVGVVNLLGSEVSRLFEGELAAGEHSFTWEARGVPPGMYECIVRMNGHAQELPLVLTR